MLPKELKHVTIKNIFISGELYNIEIENVDGKTKESIELENKKEAAKNFFYFFSDSLYFSRKFKSIIGILPSKYKQYIEKQTKN